MPLVTVAAALALTAAVGGSSTGGGTYRVGWEGGFGFSDGFDPTGEYSAYAAGIYTNLLLRTLVGYNHVAGIAGDRLVPDLATAVPAPAKAGTTYVFHLKRGIRFGPPVSRPIRSSDVAYAFERLANPKDGAEYSFYYSVIAGFTDYGAGATRSISGISTPDDRTIVFHLTRRTGDFLYRLAMPATAPIPREVAACFEGQPGRYGRYLVSSGPYMIDGADRVDASRCTSLEPFRGFDGLTQLTLVRNPEYRPSTDSRAARQSAPDEFQFTIDSNATDILDKVAAGELDDETATVIPPQALEDHIKRAALKRYLHVDGSDSTTFLALNLTQPPFDDIHVRRALNWVMDKAALRQVWGGPAAGRIANHIVPDSIFDDQLAGYSPYKTPGDHGSVADARRALKGSKYDTDRDGLCGAPQCKHVLLLSEANGVYSRMLPTLEASAARIGITFKVHTVSGAFPVLQRTANNIPIADFPGWGKDYPDAFTYFAQFDGRNIVPSGNSDWSLVGVTPEIAARDGITGSVRHVPNVDSRLDGCGRESGRPRLACYEELDRYLMTQVVPWVPYLSLYAAHITSSHVRRWGFDQSTGQTAFAHVAVKP
jgi:peptide/nickel transport system substrate-binding protein